MFLNQRQSWTLAAVSVAVIGMLTSGCNSSDGPSPMSDSALTVALPAPIAATIVSADSTQCPYGGSVIETFRDSNVNGILDAGETVLSSSVVCNGATGAQGAQGDGAGILVAQAPSASCPNGGSVFTTFIDANNNGILDAGETVTSVSTLCNGLDGQDGSDGSSAHITVTAADSSLCPNGGAVYSSYEDGQTPTLTTVCNGTNGTNGTTLEMGALGPAVPNEAFSACHYDYLYIPGTATAAGWLVFRHQGNGSLDQGIGSTGFEVWNVDISDFLLSSEVGEVNYCQCHWDPTTKLLTYTILDADDGFQGQAGSVQF